MNYTATALLLNWKRPENLKRIIENLRCQSVPVEILLWNNDPDSDQVFDVDQQFNSPFNKMCWPRWEMSKKAQGDFVFSMDDDLLPTDPKFVEDSVAFAVTQNCGVGVEGKTLDYTRRYMTGRRFTCQPNLNRDVDILMGRFILTSRTSLGGLAAPVGWGDEGRYRVEDDIVISSMLPRKVLPACLHRRTKNLPTGSESLHLQPAHRMSRELFTRRYF